MRRESDVRSTLTRALRANDAVAQPIESGVTGLGIPDLFVRTRHTSAWVELKYQRYEPRLPHKITFEDGQWPWLTTYWAMGGVSVLGLWTPSGLHCWANQNIWLEYPNLECDLLMSSISGRRFIEWIDSL